MFTVNTLIVSGREPLLGNSYKSFTEMTAQLIPLIPAERQARKIRRENSICPDLWECLDKVKDPEIPALSLWDMGILQNIELEQGQVDKNVVVTITPTYSGCPAMDVIREDIESVLLNSGYEQVSVVSKLSPAWTTDWMTAEAKNRLRDYGIAPPEEMDHMHVQCPQCGSKNTRLISEFGSMACKALMQCRDCEEAFDHFKRI